MSHFNPRYSQRIHLYVWLWKYKALNSFVVREDNFFHHCLLVHIYFQQATATECFALCAYLRGHCLQYEKLNFLQKGGVPPSPGTESNYLTFIWILWAEDSLTFVFICYVLKFKPIEIQFTKHEHNYINMNYYQE